MALLASPHLGTAPSPSANWTQSSSSGGLFSTKENAWLTLGTGWWAKASAVLDPGVGPLIFHGFPGVLGARAPEVVGSPQQSPAWSSGCH